MSTMIVFVGNLQLPPFPAGQPASEVYKTLKDAYGGGILVGPNGVGILNNSNLVPAGNYTYVPAAAVVPRVGVAPYATARVGPYATFTYATAPGIPPLPAQVTGVPPIATGVTSQTTGLVAPIAPGVPALERLAPLHVAAVGMGGSNETGVATLATGVATLDRVHPYGTTGVIPNATTARIAPLATTRNASANPKISARASESQVPQNVEAPPQQAYRGVVVQEQKAENSSPVSNSTTGGGPSRATVAARGKLPDWSPQELKKLILAKKQEWEHATCGTPLQKKMASGKEKWKIIAENLVNEGMKNPVRDHSSCKKKWEKVTGEFKKVYDYERMVCNAEESYYAMSASDRRRKNLPSNFSEEVYEMIVDWLPTRHEADPSALHIIDSSTRSLDDEAPASDSTPVDAASEDLPIEYDDPDLQFSSPTCLGDPADGQSGAAPQVDRSANRGKRKRLLSEAHGRRDSVVLHGSTMQQQIADLTNEDILRRKLHAEAQLELRRDTLDRREACIVVREEKPKARHRATLAARSEVGLANAESVRSVADALVQIVAAQLGSRDS